ncbi:uncharacterized protein CEXT_198851 [Caerostris extrusa]|uniref:Uncharacterized protein n=1 Tax=Caerostris extrusa TaxID=172846 RepID=A0AAV4WMS3_CAEEX|nr:uncharacterized protein CEXT_198851 [Caerostris extrusa]
MAGPRILFLIRKQYQYPKVKKLIRSSVTPPVPSFHTSGPCMRTLVDAQKLFPPSSKSKDSLERMSWLHNSSTYLITYCSGKERNSWLEC